MKATLIAFSVPEIHDTAGISKFAGSIRTKFYEISFGLVYQETLEKLLEFEPELIVGSSMGGYFAYHLGTHFKTNLLLLNPALPNRSFDPPILPDGKEKSRIWAMVGKNDTDVPAKENIEILKRAGAKVQIGDHEHRTPIEVFKPFFNSVLKEI